MFPLLPFLAATPNLLLILTFSFGFIHGKGAGMLYGVLSGSGEIWIDGEVHAIKAGDWFRVSPAGKRAIRAAENEGITFICMQTKAGSLENYTMTDGVMCEEKAPWLK